VAKRELHRGRRLNMQRNKIHAVTVIAAVARELGVDELKNLLEMHRQDPDLFKQPSSHAARPEWLHAD
jgi:hypothetical protein